MRVRAAFRIAKAGVIVLSVMIVLYFTTGCTSSTVDESDKWIKVKSKSSLFGFNKSEKEIWIDQRRLNFVDMKTRQPNYNYER